VLLAPVPLFVFAGSPVKAREYVPYSNPVTFQEVLQGSSWSRSFYGPDEKLRVFQRTGMESSGMRTTFVEHRYDALGRRVLTRTQRDSTCTGTVPACLSTIDRFIWDGDQLMAEHRLEASPWTHGDALEAENSYGTLSGSGTTANFLGRIRYTHGPGIDAPLVVWQSGEALVPHANINGGYEAGSTLSGSMVSMYWPSRDRTAYYAPDVRAPRTGPTHWVGSLMDAQADASGLMYRRNRYYDPASGRFTQPDPIGLAGGLNLYGYADGDPVNYSDPFGLTPVCLVAPTACAAAIVAVGKGIAAAARSPAGQQITARATNQLATINRQVGKILQELSKHDHLSAARLERTGRLQTGYNHAKEVSDFANGLRNSSVRLKQIMSNQAVSESVRSEAAQLLSRTSHLLDELKNALRP
jgi:RHS repeat-associated protein